MLAKKSRFILGLRKKYATVIISGIVIYGSLLRLARIGEPSMWFDELYTVRVSGFPLSSVIPEALVSRHLPFYYLVLHFWSRLGSSDTWVRLLPAAAGIATIGLSYAIGRRLFSTRAGLWAGAFAAVSPFLIWYSRDATVYAWAIVTSLASLYFLVRAGQSGGRVNWALYVFASTAALFTHFYSFLFLLAEVPFFILMQKGTGRRLKPWLFCQATILLALIPWSLALQKAKSYTQGSLPNLRIPGVEKLFSAMGTAPVTFIKGYAGLMGMGEGALSLTSNHKIALILGLLAAIPLLIAGYRCAGSEPKRNLLAITALVFLVISLPVLLHLAQGEFNAGRYYAMGAPVFFLWLSALIDTLPLRVNWVIGGLLVLVMIFMFNLQRAGYYYEDWRSVMGTVTREAEPGDELLCFPLHHCVVAQDHYRVSENSLSLPVKGGGLSSDQPEKIWIASPDAYWRSFGDSGGGGQMIYDIEELEQYLAITLKEANRIWLVGGTGNYPQATFAEQALSSQWDLEYSWNYIPLTLKLYQRKTEPAAPLPG